MKFEHLSDEQLALHVYGDAADTKAEAAAVEQHLAECGQCRQEFERWRTVLQSVEVEVPERNATYEADVWHNLRAYLDDRVPHPDAAPQRGARKGGIFAWFAPQRLIFAGAAIVLVVAAFLGGRVWEKSHTAPGGVNVATGGEKSGVVNASTREVRERIMLVAVGDHLDRSQMVLIELANAQPRRSMDISAQQVAARQLLDDNRLYRQTAMQVHDTAVADVLDELERLLVDISHRPTQVSEREFDDLRQRIEAQGILFKVRVLGTQVREREREARFYGSSRGGPTPGRMQ